MKKVKMLRVVQISNALSFFTNAGGENTLDLVTGDIGYLALSFRIATTQELLKPFLIAYNKTREPLVEQSKIPLKEGETGQQKIDVKKLEELLAPLLEEEVEIPDLKPITWTLLQKAKIKVDPALVMMLGDFLTGEPAEE